MSAAAHSLPVDALRVWFLDALGQGPVVLTAPTGSGKSTHVPRWCRELGRVLVIEPRRVACRGLAQRVADLENVSLGAEVGYLVRDDRRAQDDTAVTFATPGVVLRWFADGAAPTHDVVIIDEFHERGWDVDLLLGLLLERGRSRLVIMSATLDAGRIAAHVGAKHLHAEGRVFPIEVGHVAGRALLPEPRGLEERLLKAVGRAADLDGDILVFLPGKAEIAAAQAMLERRAGLEVLPVHGGLTLSQQNRVFSPGEQRRIILATNVAETSITIPRVGVVVDSGLVRRTRYHNGRAYLTLVPVAVDSADQRAGRAGRTGPGTCLRLWSPEAVLVERTPPEIHREALAPLSLACAAAGADIHKIPFLDPPKAFALEDALADLGALGALDGAGGITERGRRLFGLPLDPALGALLIESERSACLGPAIDLVSALSVGRPLFKRSNEGLAEEDDLRACGCDGTALITAVRSGDPRRHRLDAFVLGEARANRRRLREAFGLARDASRGDRLERELLLRAVLRSDARAAYVARHRRGRVRFGNGGTEIELARESAVEADQVEAIAVLSSMALSAGHRRDSILATAAMPVRFDQLAREGLGRERVEHAARERNTVVARVVREYAGQIIDSREEVPSGELARQAVAELFLAGRIFREAAKLGRERLAAVELARRLVDRGGPGAALDLGPWEQVDPVPTLEDWISGRLVDLGLQSGEDLALLTEADLLVADLPAEARAWLDQHYPRSLRLGDATYEVEYDLIKSEATLVKREGKRKDPPSLATLPAFTGFRVRVRHHTQVWTLRQR